MDRVRSPEGVLFMGLVVCAFLVLLGLCGPTIARVVKELSIPTIQWTGHAARHAESEEIRQCLEKGNVEQVWINSSGERLNCLVKTSQGIGDAVIQWSKRQACWIGVTAYQIGGGDITSAEGILKAKSCTQVWP